MTKPRARSAGLFWKISYEEKTHSPQEKVMQMKNSQFERSHDQGELRIVVGVDGSKCSDLAVDFAAHEAARWGALLHIVSAYEMAPNEGWVVVPLEPFEEN